MKFLHKPRLKVALSPLVLALALPHVGFSSIIGQRNIVIEGNNSGIVSQFASITGTVKDNQGNPLPGVIVKVKNTNHSTVTGTNGAFALNITGNNQTLVISFLGFKTKEIALGGKTNIAVVLEDEVSDLDEVVVIGYGTVKKRDLTGAVASVKAEEIAANPVSNPMESLQGKVSGLDIQRVSGKTGAEPNILLRGRRSITAEGTPLYIIDGIPGGSISSLNPNDIESIEVLKDASSTAIYGSEGANGVIIITTKKGQEGKVQIDVDSYYGINQVSKYPKPLIGDAWIQYLQDKYYATYNQYATDLSALNISAPAKEAIDKGQWVDWTDETFRTGIQQNHFVSVRGGTERTQGYFSLGYIGEEGVYKNDNLTSYNMRAGADNKFNNYVKAGIQTTFNFRDQNSTNSRVNKAFSTYPLGVPYTEDGSVNFKPIDGDPTVSIIANYASGVLIDNRKNFNIQINPYLEITPIKNLSIRSNFGARLANSRNGYFASEKSYNIAVEGTGLKEAAYSTSLTYNYIWENIVNYNFTLNKDHNFTVTGVTSWQDNRREASSISGTGLDYDEFSFYNIGALKNILGNGKSSSFYGTKKLSFAGRLNYSYKGKYLLTLTNRWDGASQLVQKWASFPAVAGAWRISDEDFMSSTKDWLNNMKLRVGYGVSGTANVNAYQTTTEVISGSNAITLGGTARLPLYILKQSLGNTDITWEKSYNTNIGLDLSFLRDRLDVTMEYYQTKTKGILYARNMPSTEGGLDAKNPYTKLSNIADSENKGFELGINSKNIVKKNFKWNTGLTFTRASEKLLSIDLGDGKKGIDDLIAEKLFIGRPIRTFYDYKKIGVWQLDEATEAAKYGAKPGDIKLATNEKFNDNGESDGGEHAYSATDKMVLGHENPDWTLGLQNTFKYKDFDLGVFMTARYGQMIDASILGFYNTLAQPATYNYWTPTNPTNDYPSPIMTTGINTTYQSALRFVDGSYFKVKNITLGYTLPKNISDKVKMTRARVYGTMYNPIIFTKSHLLKDVDPETGGSDQFPLYKQVVFGINLSF